MAVYFVVDPSHELTKVGKSKDIPKRMVALQTGNPTSLELMGWLDVHDDYALERALHAHTAERLKKFITMNIQALARGAEFAA